MKKATFLFIMFLILIINVRAQEKNYIALSNEIHYVYVGSLPKNSVNVVQKLKVEVFGGTYSSAHLATTTYSIGTRDKNNVSIERTGGDHDFFELVIYDNGDGYDFVIQTTAQYVSLNIKATLLANNGQFNTILAPQNIDIKKYDPTGKRIANSDFTQTIMTSTNRFGHFGIGTLSPKSMLDVRGTIVADAVEVKVNKGWSDFVFDKNYQLPTLEVVEQHINDKGHLPDIPSEKEVLENGVNVVEMQAKLLQKIEELTLYVIEQDKKIKEQDKKIEGLQSKLESKN